MNEQKFRAKLQMLIEYEDAVYAEFLELIKPYNEELKKQRKIMKVINIKFHERQICVSKKECIKSTRMVYNEEEVI